MKKIAVMLSGCGVYDGSEIYEATLTMLRLDHNGVAYQCVAPDVEQMHVINHLTGEEMPGEKRNVLVEAARLARGEIISLADARAEDYDALIFPGGFGAAKNLSNFAVMGDGAVVLPEVLAFARGFVDAGKPVGLICIAPALAPLIFGPGVQCTIGNDTVTASAIAAMGGEHRECPVNDTIIDEERKLISTPAYMLAGNISEASSGIFKLVDQIVQWVQ